MGPLGFVCIEVDVNLSDVGLPDLVRLIRARWFGHGDLMAIVVFDDLQPLAKYVFHAILAQYRSNDVLIAKHRGIAGPEVDFKALLIFEVIAFKIEATTPAEALALRFNCLIHTILICRKAQGPISAAGQPVHAGH